MSIILKLVLVMYVPALNPNINTDIIPDKPVKPDPDKPKKPDETASVDIFFSICSFAANLICDIVPLLILIDSQFIKILTFDATRQYEFDQIAK